MTNRFNTLTAAVCLTSLLFPPNSTIRPFALDILPASCLDGPLVVVAEAFTFFPIIPKVAVHRTNTSTNTSTQSQLQAQAHNHKPQQHTNPPIASSFDLEPWHRNPSPAAARRTQPPQHLAPEEAQAQAQAELKEVIGICPRSRLFASVRLCGLVRQGNCFLFDSPGNENGSTSKQSPLHPACFALVVSSPRCEPRSCSI